MFDVFPGVGVVVLGECVGLAICSISSGVLMSNMVANFFSACSLDKCNCGSEAWGLCRARVSCFAARSISSFADQVGVFA